YCPLHQAHVGVIQLDKDSYNIYRLTIYENFNCYSCRVYPRSTANHLIETNWRLEIFDRQLYAG
ncbi:MAG: hypothetical protein OEV87_00455, partial [Phycisphaerae bacterium]|nr:hypothetical protein [Phycisphaerae bacterium]